MPVSTVHIKWIPLGIHRVPTPVYRQAYDGVVEILFDIIMSMVKSMFLVAHINGCYWNYATDHALLVRNDTPRRADGQTPNFLWDGSPTNVNKLRIFGCRAFIKDNQAHGSVNPRGQAVRYLGPVNFTLINLFVFSVFLMDVYSRRTLIESLKQICKNKIFTATLSMS